MIDGEKSLLRCLEFNLLYFVLKLDLVELTRHGSYLSLK